MMRLLLIFIISCLLAICVAEEQQDTDLSTEPRERILMTPKTIKLKISSKPIQQPLISLYKTYVGKKPVMRKFVPVHRITEPPVIVARRPLMKPSQLIVGVAVKPHMKEDINITFQRRIRPVSFLKIGDKKNSENITRVVDNQHDENQGPDADKSSVAPNPKETVENPTHPKVASNINQYSKDIFVKPTDNVGKEN